MLTFQHLDKLTINEFFESDLFFELHSLSGMSIFSGSTETVKEKLLDSVHNQQEKVSHNLVCSNGKPVGFFSLKTHSTYFYYDTFTDTVEDLGNAVEFSSWFVSSSYKNLVSPTAAIMRKSLEMASDIGRIAVFGVRAQYYEDGTPMFLSANRDCWSHEPRPDYNISNGPKNLSVTHPSFHPDSFGILKAAHLFGFNMFGLDAYDGSPKYRKFLSSMKSVE